MFRDEDEKRSRKETGQVELYLIQSSIHPTSASGVVGCFRCMTLPTWSEITMLSGLVARQGWDGMVPGTATTTGGMRAIEEIISAHHGR